MTERYKVFTECRNCFNKDIFTLNRQPDQKESYEIGSVFINKLCVKCNKLGILKIYKKLEIRNNA